MAAKRKTFDEMVASAQPYRDMSMGDRQDIDDQMSDVSNRSPQVDVSTGTATSLPPQTAAPNPVQQAQSAPDMSVLSNADLQHIASGNMAGVSTEALQHITGQRPIGQAYSNTYAGGLLGGAPLTHKAVESDQSDLSNLLLGDGLGSPMTKAGMAMSGLEGVARVGRKAKEGLGMLGGLIGPKTEKAANIASDLIIPQNKIAAGMTLTGAAGEMDPEKGMVLADRTRVAKPNGMQKLGGQLVTSTTAIPERYTSAVMADPSILGEGTQDMASVAKEYTKMFEKMGEKFDTKLAQKYLNKNYVPTENEAGKINKYLFELYQKIEGGYTPKPAEAFLARSQAAALERSNSAVMNKTLKGFASGMKNAMDENLENNGVPEIKDLSAKYFKAVAKEHFQSMLPQNKNMSPNALRTMIMLGQGARSVGAALTGNPGPALGHAVEAASMSPFLVGGAIRTASTAADSPAVANSAKSLTMASLNSLQKGKKK